MKLGGMAQKIIGALASGGVSRGSTGGARAAMRGAQPEDDGAEDTGRFSRDSEPPMSLADQRRQTAAAAVSRPLDLRGLTQSRARNIDPNAAARDAQLAEAMAGIERAGYAAAGRPGGASAAEYMERIRRARGY